MKSLQCLFRALRLTPVFDFPGPETACADYFFIVKVVSTVVLPLIIDQTGQYLSSASPITFFTSSLVASGDSRNISI